MSKTSSAVKHKYGAKVYKVIHIDTIKKELVMEWEKKLLSDGITKAGFIRQAIKNYLDKQE